MAPQFDVFLSHSSADKPEVEDLAHKLREVGIEPFLDKWHLIPGEPWQEALEDALDQSRTCAVFLGPGGIGAWQNEEMRSALETRVRDKSSRVIPVLLPGSFEPQTEELPRFLRRLTWVDFRKDLDDEDAFRRLVSGIRGEAPGPGGGGGGSAKPSLPLYRTMAQPPDEGFVHRGEYDAILEALCPKGGPVQSGTSVGITTALRGAGGFGKTALAQKLCQDERVRETYPDGILWTTMGEDVDANGRLSRIRDLIRWWTREEAPAFETVAAAGARLRELLGSSRALLVIDDVWSSADVTPFQGLGNGAALLITTRDSRTLPSTSKPIEVDAMVSNEAVSLLSSGLPDGQERDFQSLAARLGEWPLLLTLVNRQLKELVRQDGFILQEALQITEKALNAKGFSAFKLENEEDRNGAADRTISVSIRRLSEEESERYLQLAVFPEDTDIPIPLLERFWNLTPGEGPEFCRRLHGLSLLLRFDRKKGTVRLHDVVRQVLIEKLESGVSVLHRHLLDTFQPASGSWSDLLVEERYIWRNLVGHFLGAGRKEELRRLLMDLSFLQAKLNATDVNAFMADYESFVYEERELQLVRDALRLSAHVLARDRQQLASQLFGRLTGLPGKSIEKLVNRAGDQLRLRPRKASLTQPGGPLLLILEGHSGWVRTVALVDGRRAISGSDDGTLRVWDLENGETLRSLEGHSGRVNAVAVVNSRRAISCSNDETLRVWDLENGETLRILEGHWNLINAVAVVDDHRAISGSDDGTLRVWDLETSETLRILEGHLSRVNTVAVVDGCQALSGSDDGTLRLWDLENGKTLRTLEGHSGGVNAVAVVDGHRALSGSEDRTLRMWDLENGKTLLTFKGHSDWVNAVAVVDGRMAVSGSADGTMRMWDLENGKNLLTLEECSHGVNALVVDGRRAISGSSDRTLRVWDLENDKTLRSLEGHSGKVNALAVMGDRQVVSGSSDGTLQVWNLETGEPLRTLKTYTGRINAVVVHGRQAISGSDEGTLRVSDWETGQTLRTIRCHSGRVGTLAVVDDHQAVSGSSDGMLRVWDLQTGKTLQTLKGHSSKVNTVAVLDGYRVVSGSDNWTLRAWDLETGQTLQTFRGHSGGVNAVVVVDNRRVVSGSSDRALRVWNLETGETLRVLEGHSGGVRAVAVVDGRRAISGSDDRTLRVWDLETGEALSVVTLEAPILAVAVTPDGRIVVAGDQSGRVHFLDLVPET
jgi:WD40 repeat protein